MKENTFNKVLKEEKAKKSKRIYRYKEFQTEYILLYPLMVLVYWLDKLGHYLRNRTQWSDKRTERIITYAFPKKADIDKEKGTIGRYFREWGFYWKSYAKWYNKWYCEKYNSAMLKYLIENFELKGFTKEVNIEEFEWTYVKFIKNN